MNTFGLTGGIGMGKTTAARLLAERGVAMVDTDELARQLVESGKPALAEIERIFGAEILDSTGALRRDELGRRVFADAAARKELEAILHPRIQEHWLAQLKDWRNQGHAAAVVVIPLLFETNAASYFNKTICIACSAATQRARLRERSWSAEQIAQRVGAQWPIQKKMDLSDYVIWTEGTMEALAGQLLRVVH